MLPHTWSPARANNGDTVTGVETEHGRHNAAKSVVDAAGAWLRAVAALTGARVAVVPTRHQLMITQPIPGVHPNSRSRASSTRMSMCVPMKAASCLAATSRTPLQFDPAALPAGFDIADLELDLSVLRGLADSVKDQLPIFQRVPDEIGVRVHRGGLPTMTADGEHTVGPAPGCVGSMSLADAASAGLSTSPAFGEALAAWIIDGNPPMDLSPLAPGAKAAWTRTLRRGLPAPIRAPLLGGGAGGKSMTRKPAAPPGWFGRVEIDNTLS